MSDQKILTYPMDFCIGDSSEVEEKTTSIDFCISKLKAGVKAANTVSEPFKMIKDTSLMGKCPVMCTQQTSIPHY
jgi:hypothetical protein